MGGASAGWMPWRVLLALALALASPPALARAAPGDMDPTFGTGGSVAASDGFAVEG
jgi:hypothetical protein